ncbi:hypothetical protein PS850_01852 [Pseudomonas fluorescens]|nr:hypothetical protein PS850_01852 [Pseudomonas fluorescens]
MDVNDDEGCLDERGALTFFASKLAPTRGMHWRHGFNEFLSIVSCFARPQDEAVGAALAL